MLRYFVVIWLMVCTLGYGSVGAFDGHFYEAAHHNGVTGDLDHSPGEGGGHPSCDHCCHASAHLLALWAPHLNFMFPGTSTGYTPYRFTLSFPPIIPPTRPPQS